MRRWLSQLGFGLALGVAARAVLPGHHPGGYALAALLSVLGAAGGGAVAEAVLPAILPKDALRPGGVVLSGIGAIAGLLIQALLVR